MSELWASVVTISIGLTKEIKDALVPSEEYGFWGGTGFSYQDLVYDAAGLFLALVTDLIWPPHIRPPRRDEEEEELEEIIEEKAALFDTF